MTRAEAELHSIRTTIEAYEMILKNNAELSEDDKNNIRKKITELGEVRDKILSEIYNQAFKIFKTMSVYGAWVKKSSLMSLTPQPNLTITIHQPK